MSDLTCTGEESNIALCGNRGWGSHDCSHDQDAAVVCSNDIPQPHSIDIRLTDTQGVGDGRVEVMFNGVWGRVCSNSWDIRDGDVVCKQLGFTGARAVKFYTSVFNLDRVWMDNVHCIGQEKNLSKCSFDGWGHTNSSCHDAGVECELFTSDNLDGNYEIRLAGGPTEREGRVEIFVGGVWGTVCDTHWTIDHAHVVCRQLGYSSALASYKGSWYGGGSGLVLIDGVECSGSESRLVDCSFSGWGRVNQHCIPHLQDVSVKCGGELLDMNCCSHAF